MGTQFYCENENRIQAVREHVSLNGIEFLEVLDSEAEAQGGPRQQTLLVHCIKDLPATISAANADIRGGMRVKTINVEWVARAGDAQDLFDAGQINLAERDYLLDLAHGDRVLVVRTDRYGDYSFYRLCLVTDDAPLDGFDVMLAEVAFSFKVECPSEFDCAPVRECPPEPGIAPPIDYLSKDYASFRQLMLDRLAVTMPQWQERHAADIGIAVVEILAYAADYLSYYQDAAANEAYLGTARQRPSLRRHARLLDYRMHEGCNARVWVCLRVEEGVQDVLLPVEYVAGRKTQFLTRIPGQSVQIAEAMLTHVLADYQPVVFEPLYEIRLYEAHNAVPFYTWGNQECCLPRGTTRATLLDDPDNRLRLRTGDVLVFEEVLGAATGQAADADPAHRHAVRLTRVEPEATVNADGSRSAGPLMLDDLFDAAIVEIEWSVEDALPFPLCISTMVEENFEEVLYENMSIAYGNIVLADHGLTISGEGLQQPSGDKRYSPPLSQSDITYANAFSAQDWENGTDALSAAAAVQQSPQQSLPAVALLDSENRNWSPVLDLLASGRFDAYFVVEVDNRRQARLRFGDNTYGQIPEQGVTLEASYRIGSGVAGNVGAASIAHVVTTPGIGLITDIEQQSVRNPLPASGGVQPESLEEVRQYAPQAFRTQQRAVTEADYADVAQQHPQVSKAVARRLWTGSWHTMFITVDRVGGREVDTDFEQELTGFISRYRLAGHDIEIEPPQLVPLEIHLRVCVQPNYLASDVKLALLQLFSSGTLADGMRGYFHPDNFTFGQAVYLSDVIAAAMTVAGVRWVDMDTSADPPARFQRWGEKSRGEIEQGYIGVGRLEIAQLDNDPNAPENGKIDFYMQGGI